LTIAFRPASVIFNQAADQATGLVELVNRGFRPLGVKAVGLRAGASERSDHPDLDRIRTIAA
jgi:hypothetical protein